MADILTDPRFVRFAETALNKGLGDIARRLENGPGFVGEDFDASLGFYAGNDAFLPSPAENARWKLGYAIVDLTPADHRTHDYFLGGYLTAENGFNNRVNEIIDKMECRIIALDDGSGRGVSLFATVDCIGLGNRHVKAIRSHLRDLMKYEGVPGTLCTVNVFSTHAHSCVDTQGLWTDTLKKLKHNYKKNRTGRGVYREGADPEFMRALVRKVAEGMLCAVKDMKPGTMTFAEKDVGQQYFSNRNRPSATALGTHLIRLLFTPDDAGAVPTILASFPAHPDTAGLPTRDGQGSGRALCGEYIYYMGELINAAGYNFIFINGAICAIYMNRGPSNDGVTLRYRYEQSIRYGREMAKITLALTKTAAEIEADPLLYDIVNTARDMAESEANGGGYTLWYENWQPVKEIPVPPLLNIRLRQVTIPVTNPLIILVGKLNLVAYDVIAKKDGAYAVTTEVGYLELGGVFKAVLAPGEFCQDLLWGGDSLTAAGAWHERDFSCPPLSETFGGDIHAFGLANDAIGYIVPDNDYILGEFKNHYHEIISLGEHTGSTVVKALRDLKEALA